MSDDVKKVGKMDSVAVAITAVAGVVYFLTLHRWLFPGSSALGVAKYMGAFTDPGAMVSRPVLTALLGSMGLSAPIVYNILGVLVGMLNVWLVGVWVRGFLTVAVSEHYSEQHIGVSARYGGWAAMAVMAFLPAVWKGSTHFQFQAIDLLTLQLVLCTILSFVRHGSWWRLGIAGVLVGLFAGESPCGTLLAPILGLTLLSVVIVCSKEFTWLGSIFKVGAPMLVGFLLSLAGIVLLSRADGCELPLVEMAAFWIRDIRVWMSESLSGRWILIFVFGIVPMVLAMGNAPKILNNERSVVGFVVLVILASLTLVALVPLPVSPFVLAEVDLSDAYPMMVAMCVAASVGYVFCASSMLKRVTHAKEGHGVNVLASRTGYLIGMLLPPVLAGMMTLGALITLWTGFIAGDNGTIFTKPVAQRYAQTLFEELDGQKWIFGDGFFDAYLAAYAKEQGQNVTLLRPELEDNEVYVNQLKSQIESDPDFVQDPALRESLLRSLSIGVVTFVQDWVAQDPNIQKQLVFVNNPDMWYVAKKIPVPRGMAFFGATTKEEQMKLTDAAQAHQLIDELDPVLVVRNDRKRTAMVQFIKMFRRHVGFIGNDVAFYLADMEQNDKAFALFQRVRKFDPDNVCARLNLFALVMAGMHPEQKEAIGKDLDSFIKSLKGRRYHLWMLSRYYGYVRDPQMFAALAGQWALSGQTGAALTGLGMAQNMMSDEQRSNAQQSIAAIYSMDPSKRKETIALYQQMLATATDPNQQAELLRQLARCAVLDDNFKQAEEYLTRSGQLARNEAELGFEWALFYMAQGDVTKARLSLQRFTDVHPKSLPALAMLASIQFQGGEIEDVRQITLKRMEAAVGSPDNYYIQIVRAELARYDKDIKRARECYIRAYMLRSSVYQLRNTILRLDMELNDRTAAELHARQFIRIDRTHALSNYAMGSILLNEGKVNEAIGFLKVATDPTQNEIVPEAYNDLAEAYRRVGDLDNALRMAQRTVEINPSMYFAKETIAALLLQQGKAAEAESVIVDAIATQQKLIDALPASNTETPRTPDPQLYITQGNILLALGRPEQARLAAVRARQQQARLTPYDQQALQRLLEACKLPNK